MTSSRFVEDTAPLSPAARRLRLLVILMAVLILVGLTIVVTTILVRSGSLVHEDSTKAALPVAETDKILSVDLEGARLLVHVIDGTTLEQTLFILDADTGAVITDIHVPRSIPPGPLAR